MYNTKVRMEMNEIQPAEEKAVFFETSNKGYGENWLSADNETTNPVKKDDIPSYKEIGERDLALKHI